METTCGLREWSSQIPLNALQLNDDEDMTDNSIYTAENITEDIKVTGARGSWQMRERMNKEDDVVSHLKMEVSI